MATTLRYFNEFSKPAFQLITASSRIELIDQKSASITHRAVKLVCATKSSHITPVLKSLHWLKINERIKYKLLSHNKPTSISLQLDFCSTLSQHTFFIYGHSCSSTYRSSLKITNCSFRYAASCLWNELPTDLRELRKIQSPSLSSITHGSSPSSS